MTETPRVPPEVLARRTELGARVVAELHRAGLPAYLRTRETPAQAGAEVVVDDLAAEEGGGVTVEWHPDPGLRLAALGVSPGDDAPERAATALAGISRTGVVPDGLRHADEIGAHMQRALIGILVSAGLDARDLGDEDDPHVVRVGG